MTDSFGITPQRQLRDTYVQPEQTQRAAPATPEMTPQRRGGELLDYNQYTPDLRIQQRLNSIEQFVDSAKAVTNTAVKQESTRQAALAEAAFDKMAQTEIDSLEIGEIARSLRKKGHNKLADDVVVSNPWFNYQWQTSRAGRAAQNTAFNVSDWVNNNIDDLKQIEDPSEVTRRINEQSQNYLQKNFPGMSPQLYTAVVSPALAEVEPKLAQTVRDEHRTWKLNFLTQSALEKYNQAVSLWVKTQTENPNNPVAKAAANTLLADTITAIDLNTNQKGLSFDQINEKIRSPFYKEFPVNIVEPEQGVSDIADRGLFREFMKAIDIDLPGQKGKKILDQLDPESGETYRYLIQQAHANARELESKRDQDEQNRINRANKTFTELFEMNQRIKTQGLPQGQAQDDVKTAFLKSIYEAQNAAKQNNKASSTVKMFVIDENGDLAEEDVEVPPFLDLWKLNDITEKGGFPIDPQEFEDDKQALLVLVGKNPTGEFPDIYEKYEAGSEEWKALKKVQANAIKNWTKKDWNAEVKMVENKASAIAERLNLNHKNTNTKTFGRGQTKKVEKQYSNALKWQKIEAVELAQRYTRKRISEVDAEVLNDPAKREAFFAGIETDLQNHMEGDSLFTDPTQFIKNRERQSEDTLYVYDKNEHGNVIGDVSRVLDNSTFLRVNAPLINKNLLVNYYKEEPMIGSDSARDVLNGLVNPSAQFTPASLNDLKAGFELANALKPGTSVEEFLTGQFGKNVYAVENFQADRYQAKLNELRNRLQTTTINRASKVKLHNSKTPTGAISGSGSGLSFHIEHNTNGAKKIQEITAPIRMQIRSIEYDEGGLGNYSLAIALQDYRGIKKGDVIKLAHARNFVGKPGTILSAGQTWGYQHRERDYDKDVDGGTGFHLYLEIERNGLKLPTSDLTKIYNDLLSHRLSP